MDKTRIFQCVLLATSLFVGVCPGQQRLDSMVVVLSNFGVIRGQVSNTADGLSVRMNSGSIAVLRIDQIACLAESLDQAYGQLLAATDPEDAGAWTRLFDWCLRNGLADRAAELLDSGKSRSVDPAALQLMRRRLESSQAGARRAENQAWPSDVERVRETPRSNQQEIDETIAALPDGIEKIFNQQLHSKLVIGCTAAKCHSRDSDSLAIWHHGKGVATPRGMTRHNLHQVLQYIDRDNPSTSKILEMALTAHGGQTKPTLERGDATFLVLQNWTYAVSRHPEYYWTEVVQNVDTQRSAKQPVGSPTAAPESAISQVGFVESSATPIAPPQTTGHSDAPRDAPPTDPCDPILFNRRHHPERNQ